MPKPLTRSRTSNRLAIRRRAVGRVWAGVGCLAVLVLVHEGLIAADPPQATLAADTASSRPTTTATTLPGTRPATTQTVVNAERAQELAVQFVREKGLNWGTVTTVAPEGTRGFTVLFETPANEERAIGPRAIQVSADGKVAQAGRR